MEEKKLFQNAQSGEKTGRNIFLDFPPSQIKIEQEKKVLICSKFWAMPLSFLQTFKIIFKDPSKIKFEKVLDDEKYLTNFYFFPPYLSILPCFSLKLLYSPSLPSFVILNKVGKKERGSHRMEVNWYRTGVWVEKRGGSKMSPRPTKKI